MLSSEIHEDWDGVKRILFRLFQGFLHSRLLKQESSSMGSLCCCPGQDELEEYASYPTGCIYQHCFCLRSCVDQFLSMYSALFHRVDGRGVSSSIQSIAPSASAELLGATSLDSSSPDAYRPPPRPLPYDADTRYARLQREGLVSRREKTGSHLHEESEPLRRSNSSGGGEPLTTMQKRNGIDYEEQGQGYCPESSEKRQLSKAMTKVESTISLADDEEVCPTCLDEYNLENPKIVTKCGHHFHLGCIYEWMERSEHCPVCYEVFEVPVITIFKEDQKKTQECILE